MNLQRTDATIHNADLAANMPPKCTIENVALTHDAGDEEGRHSETSTLRDIEGGCPHTMRMQ